jgi:hypothetical protein
LFLSGAGQRNYYGCFVALAFHLLAHRCPEQVRRLLAAVWAPENTYVIHYDIRRPREEHAAIRCLAEEHANVHIQKPQAVLWGRYSLYSAQHEGLKTALAAGSEWTHWINLSGQCYPLFPIDQIERECSALADRSLVRYFDPLGTGGDWVKCSGRIRRRALDLPWLEKLIWVPGVGRNLRRVLGGVNSVPVLPFVWYSYPKDFTWYGGDNWVVLSRSAAEYLIGDPKAQRIHHRLRHTQVPEESIFQSVLINSVHGERVINSHRRCIKWIAGHGSPGLFTPDDLPLLEQAARNGAWFARKFQANAPVLDLIDQKLLRRDCPGAAGLGPIVDAAHLRR